MGELLALAGTDWVHCAELQKARLSYGAIRGSEALRTAVAALHPQQHAAIPRALGAS
ncbi:MAG: hypothetical protein VBE63_25920 [Lamprobacter sp.]|uniref:hypothetical protein n=1 Tax=Lamprobacter sp. TaxID=3100796 RepID=UPI002B26432B|nr:hypothetical protein [Lamprobacter sp.]MEA3643346.1 hypothetical protein [Lamprobacter sp.]